MRVTSDSRREGLEQCVTSKHAVPVWFSKLVFALEQPEHIEGSENSPTEEISILFNTDFPKLDFLWNRHSERNWTQFMGLFPRTRIGTTLFPQLFGAGVGRGGGAHSQSWGSSSSTPTGGDPGSGERCPHPGGHPSLGGDGVWYLATQKGPGACGTWRGLGPGVCLEEGLLRPSRGGVQPGGQRPSRSGCTRLRPLVVMAGAAFL